MMTIAMVASLASSATTRAMQQPTPAAAAKPQPTKGVVIRGCLIGSKLTHIDPQDPTLNVPDILRVSSIRVIRSQVKALDGHQVELIGTLRGIPGQEHGLLLADSGNAKVYIGGGDKSVGEDLGTERIEPTTMHAHTIKDIAPTCSTGQSK